MNIQTDVNISKHTQKYNNEFELYNTDEGNLVERLNSIILDSKIIISTCINPFLKNEYILEIPGFFICLDDYTINSNKIK